MYNISLSLQQYTPQIRRWIREHPYSAGVAGTLIAMGTAYAIERYRTTPAPLQGRVANNNEIYRAQLGIVEATVAAPVFQIPELPAEDRANPYNLITLWTQLKLDNKPTLLPLGTPLEKAMAIWTWMHGPGKEVISRFDGELNLDGESLYEPPITSLPSAIGLFHSLRMLNLNCNTLTRLPPEIGNLVSLERLHLLRNKLVELPPEIGRLTKLDYLDLRENLLEKLPSTIGQLRELSILNLKDNQLQTLPPEMGQLTMLYSIDLTKNQFKEFPDSFFAFDRDYQFPRILAKFWVLSGVFARQGVVGSHPWPIAQILVDYAKQSKEKCLSVDTILKWLNKDQPLNTRQKVAVLEKLCSDSQARFLQKLVDLRIVVDCDRADLLQTLRLEQAADAALESFLPGLDLRRYASQFGPYRDPNALRIYAGKIAIAALRDPEVIASFNDHIRSVLDGSYRAKRYALTNNLHLETIAEKFPEVLEHWQQNSVVPLTVDVMNPGSKESLKAWLLQALVREQALGDLNEYRELRDFVVHGKECALQTLKDKMRSNGILRQEERERNFLQHKICLLLDSKAKADPLAVLRDLSLSNNLFVGKEAFLKQIGTKIAEIQEHNRLVHYSVHNTDDFREFLFLKEAGGACLSYDGHATVRDGRIINQSLLAYWHHGQTRLIAVKDEKGVIKTWALLRLLWNGERPVLYAEEPQPKKEDKCYMEAIIGMIQQTGTKLGCPIFVTNSLESAYNESTFARPDKEHPLISLGGSAPFDYVLLYYSCLSPKGKFQITGPW